MTARAGARKRGPRPATARRIVDAATGLFAERHYHQVRMDDIAERAGVSKGTLYGYFKDKEDLYLGLMLDSMSRLLRQIEECLEGLGSPEEKVHAFVGESLRFFERHEHVLDLVQRVEVLHTGASGDPLREVRARLLVLLEAVMGELQAGGHAVADPKVAVLALLGMTREVARFHPRPWPEGLATRLARQFLRGVAGPG
jgi:AcrR family transcriptional regulator